MKRHLLSLLALFIITTLLCQAQQTSVVKWKVKNPFQHNVFIENKGQFTEEEKNYISQPILFYNRLGKIGMYFSASSITFRYDSITKAEDDDVSQDKSDEPDQDKNLEDIPQFLTMTWQNANPNAEIEAQDPERDYFTYGNPSDKSGHSGITAHAWKRLIYRNLYKNIDVEFYYPKDKGGIEYDIIVHPGANLSEVQMAYSGNAQIGLNGNNASIKSPCINLINHVPIAKDENGNSIATSFSVDNNSISFKTANYDETQTLTIDPWITSTSFSIYNLAYDIDYDNQGNVYIAGGQPPYELQQYDSTGSLIWTYNTITSFGGPSVWYGGFTTDIRSGSSYIVKGLGGLSNSVKAVKVNNVGTQIAEDFDYENVELWRVAFDYINSQLVIAAGENYQAVLMDTNLSSKNNIALIDTVPYYNQEAHDMSLLALDNAGTAYMGTNLSSFNSLNYNNTIFKLPLPTLFPVSDTFSDHYNFTELLSMFYYPAQINGGYDYANGFNGMAANNNMLVTYDGASLKKWRPSINALKELDSIKVTGTSFQWGGLDLDCGGNIYAGNNKSISVYDSSLNFLSSIPLDSTVYALKVGIGKLYACGADFVESLTIAISPNSMVNATASPVSYCGGGNSTLTVSGGNIYTWSPSTGLSSTSGSSVIADPTITTTYTVNAINVAGCVGTAYVTIVVTNAPLPLIIQPVSPSVCPGDGVTLSVPVSGSNYTWSPSSMLNPSTGNNVTATSTTTTTYTVTGTDSLGCIVSDSDVVSISPAPNKPTITHNGDVLTSSATQGNQWLLNDTAINGATTENYIVTQPGCYAVTAENPANGCSTTSDTTCITSLSGINQLSIYPNPSSGEINIISTKNIDELKVFNILGQLIYEAQPKQMQYNFELKEEGMYFITVTIDNEVATTRVVVNR